MRPTTAPIPAPLPGPPALPEVRAPAVERRSAVRRRIDEDALIAVDEHTSLPCLIYDLSGDGLRIVALDTQAVPQTFLLSCRRFAEGRVCSVVWRTPEEIGACFVRA